MNLTNKVIENTPGPTTGQAFLWDDDLKGFGLRLTPSVKTFIVQARVKGKTRRITLGKYGVLSVYDARRRALKELAKMNDGLDPTIEKRKAKTKIITLGEIVKEYIADRKKSKKLKDNTVKDIQKHMGRAFSDWQELAVIDVDRDMVKARFRELTIKGPTQANQAFRVLRAVFNYAIGAYRVDKKTPLLSENPVKIISDTSLWNPKNAKTEKIEPEKIGHAWVMLDRIKTAPGVSPSTRTAADAVAFLILTGARFSEMSGLTWDHVDLEKNIWWIDDPKNRTPIVFPLSDSAVEILKKRDKSSQYVFPGRGKVVKITSVRGVLSNVTKAIKEKNITPHDLRRTFQAVAQAAGVAYVDRKLLMGHKFSGNVTIEHYTETQNLKYLSPEINKIGDYIEQQANIHRAGNVVDFEAKRKKHDY